MAVNSTTSHTATSFDRAFPRRELFRGAPRSAMLWGIVGALLLCLQIVLIFLTVDLLDHQGQFTKTLSEERATRLDELTGVTVPVGSTENLGLRPFVARYADALWAPLCAYFYRNISWLQANRTALAFLVGMTMLAGLLRSLVLSRIQQLSSLSGFYLAARLRRALHRQALRLGPSDLKDTAGDDVLQLFSDDANRVQEAVSQRIYRLSRYPVELLFFLMVIFLVDWRTSAQCLIPLGFCAFLFQRSQRRFLMAQRGHQSRAEIELRVLSESFHKTRLVRGYGMENFEQQQFQKHLDRYRDSAMATLQEHRWYRWTCRGLMLVCVTVLLFFVGMKVLHQVDGSSGLYLPEFILLLLSFGVVALSLKGISTLSAQIETASISAGHIYRFLDRIPEVSQAVGAKFLQPLSQFIEFQNIHYQPSSAARSEPLLRGMDLKITAGQTVAIVSHQTMESQAVAYLLPRFIEANRGSILFDGEDILGTTLESLRAETVYVGGKDPFFTGSVLENITCGHEKFTLQEATNAAKATHAHHFVLKLSQGYETMLGEHGETLDAGHAFQLGLARAVLRNPALMIIEEPEFPLQSDTKLMLDDTYQRICKDRTVLFLPSRLSTLKRADHIVLLSHGKVEASGTHAELVKSSVSYRHWEYLRFNQFRHEGE